MNTPFWFRLVKGWREEKKGNGLTLPFIVGADARARQTGPTSDDVGRLAAEIRAFDDPCQLLIVRWCTWRLAPVIGPYQFRGGGVEIDDQLLEGGVTEERFWDALVRDAKVRVAAGDFSRIGHPPRWAPFSKEDLEFIDSVSADHE